MHAKKSQVLGIIIGIKKHYISVLLQKNKIGILSNNYFKENRFFLGQLIIGKLETCFSSVIRLKIIRELKTRLFKNSQYRIFFLDHSLAILSKNFIIKTLDNSNMEFFFNKISEFLEFNIITSTNGFFNVSGNHQPFKTNFINKLLFTKYMSL